MPKDKLIKDIEGIIRGWACSDYQEHGNWTWEDIARESAKALASRLELDEEKIRQALFKNMHIGRSGFSGEEEVAGFSRSIVAISKSDWIKIRGGE